MARMITVSIRMPEKWYKELIKVAGKLIFESGERVTVNSLMRSAIKEKYGLKEIKKKK